MTKNWIDQLNNEQLLTALIDSKIKINFIQQKFALQWNLISIVVVLSRFEFLDEECYDITPAHNSDGDDLIIET